jgi:protein pelota
MKLEIESDADLWHLKHVIEAGDTIRSDDQRTTIEGDTKTYCTLTLGVEKMDYQGDRLRTTGEITQAPDDVQRGYHTFNLEQGVTFEIWKEDWQQYQLDRVDAATATEAYEVLVCMIDKESANFALITETGIQDLSEVESGLSGKMYKSETSSEAFYGEVISILQQYGDVDRIIIAGPGFEKENVTNVIEDDYPNLAGNVTLEDASTTGMAGVQEVIKRGAIQDVLEQSRVADEVGAVEDLLKHIETDDGLATYGLDPVKEAVAMDAVELLLINDVLVHQQEDLMERVEQTGGNVQIVHEDHDAGKKLSALGGIAAILRYRIS